MVERPEGWHKELYDKLSFEYLIECAKNERIDEWNQDYEAYLRSEWERIFPGVKCDSINIGKLLNHDSKFQRPSYNKKDFNNAILEGAKFNNVHLEGAEFLFAHLEGAKFSDSHLEKACFGNAHLERADFKSAHLEGTQFILAVVNGETLFSKNTIDDKTDFTGTSLSSARILPKVRTKLEKNIRKLRWEEWYKYNKQWEIPAKIFWKFSDYGSSTRAILFTFLVSNVIFMMFYLALRDADLLNGSILSSGNDLILAYMQTTLVPFGILGIDLTTLSFFPVFVIFLQVIFGYTILAALVTRMAIMFQSLSS
jgi:uncharacterized protein YjbI with pentapeptide repeats